MISQLIYSNLWFVCLDLQLSEEMGIQLEHFDLIGGEQKLLYECGAKEIGSTSVMSAQYKNTIQVCNNIYVVIVGGV